ncbi:MULTISPECIES: DUF1254 domain-containing protein [Azorhizobium]|uniref:Putative integral membrane protein n=1 Tax=Azorhizobium caulinodans (strain ATCC 43989 / DSM 5975 / JCM 20966 / LMG 6465 / NBRC 14845 / NCIMB 13405 / ORS 571) TaxID=438753 RepID=A8HR15_AZOC5|nr:MULTISPECIES: DUF1254 domain-containing protein [Azorhizobium]TDT92697.1 putative membrane protein [Azorhizobium sp. AG788]BAF87095.1 putative integral membrane protein [Azorhizobium caulinodans ORS 571]
MSLRFDGYRRTSRLGLANPWRWRIPARAERPSLLLALAIILVLAGMVHLVSILAMPLLSERNAFRRLAADRPVNEMVALKGTGDVLPMMDPAFVYSVCLYDLSKEPLKLRVPATADYTSVSFYTARGVGFYALSDKAAGKVIELDLMTPAQKAAIPEDEEITAADRLVVVSPSTTGIALVRAFTRDRDMRDMVRGQLNAATCGPAPG